MNPPSGTHDPTTMSGAQDDAYAASTAPEVASTAYSPSTTSAPFTESHNPQPEAVPQPDAAPQPSPPLPSKPRPRTIAFFGASGGVGLAALKRAVAAGHTCIALCRVPAKLDAVFPHKPHNLIVAAGNAHDLDAVAPCLVNPADPARLVDAVNFSIGGKPDLKKLGAFDDPDVCKKGMSTVLGALRRLREDGGAAGRPLLSIVSTTGISKHQRDVPWAMVPMYKLMLKVPHEDKKVMEADVAASGERYVLVRPSFLTDRNENAEKGLPPCPIHVAIEDLGKGVEVQRTGYLIGREEVGRWMYETLLNPHEVDPQYANKAVGITW